MTTQIHDGSGDNIAGGKFVNIIHSIQTRDLKSAVDSIMRDVCYRNISIATEKLKVLNNIDSLESDVRLLLSAIQVKINLFKGSVPNKKSDLLSLLKNQSLPVDVREVVISILIDLECRSNPVVARERYDRLETNSAYINEVFFEFIASKDEIQESFNCSTKYDLLEQELTGLLRGALRIKEFQLAFKIGIFLDENFQSTNSKTLLLYSESLSILTQNQNLHYFTLEKEVKDNVEGLISQLVACIKEDDNRHITTLMSLLSITNSLDGRLVELGKKYVKKIRKLNGEFADAMQFTSAAIPFSKNRFKLTSNALDIDDLIELHIAIEHNLVKLSSVNTWLDKGANIQTGDNYVNSFSELQLRALVCSSDDKRGVQSLEIKAQKFIELDTEYYVKLNPFVVIKLCNRFIELNLPLLAIEYSSHFIPNNPWVSPIFECYLNALFFSEKYDLFLSQLKHLSSEDKTALIWLREAQVYEKIRKHSLSIKAVRASIQLNPNDPHAWHFLLFVSRDSGVSLENLKEIVFEIPEEVFSSYHESKLALVNEIAIFIDINLADKVLIDWFTKSPDKVAIALTQIHANSIFNRPKIAINPYLPAYCGDGVKYTDGFDTFNRILVKDIDVNHSSLLDITTPLGMVLESLKEGETVNDDIVGEIKLLERVTPYIAAYRLALELRNKGNDGTDLFKLFTMPSNEDDLMPYLEKILRHFPTKDKGQISVLNNPDIPLVMRGKFTNPDCPVKGAINHLTSKNSTQYMRLFNDGIETPDKVIIDIYTAVYFSLIGLVSSLTKLSMEIVLSQHTKYYLEHWIKDTLREDYLSVGVTDQGIYRCTSEDIKTDSLGFIQELQKLLKHSKVESLKPTDTPDDLLRIKGAIDNTVYSTFQLSVANAIPWLSVDHLMCTLAHKSGHPIVNTNSFLIQLLNNTSLELKKKSIELNLLKGMPINILYADIIELSRSTDKFDVYLVAQFIEKYGSHLESSEISLNFLIDIVIRVTVNAYLDGGILNSNRWHNSSYDGNAEHVFNSCCHVAIKVLAGDTAEQRLVLFILKLFDKYDMNQRYFVLISELVSAFADINSLDIQEINRLLKTNSCEPIKG